MYSYSIILVTQFKNLYRHYANIKVMKFNVSLFIFINSLVQTDTVYVLLIAELNYFVLN